MILPIVARELRVASRRRSTYWTRLGAAVTALALGGWIMVVPDLRSPQKLGITLFVTLSIFAYAYSLLAGIFANSDCLSEEKREGTLGLLFLTDLKGYDIVLGKLAATSVSAFYGMLAIFPVMAIPLLAGGVTGAEFWRVVLVSVNNLLFSLSVGMFCSAISRDERKALLLAFLILLFFTALLPLAGALCEVFWNHRPPAAFFIPSPGFGCVAAFDENYRSFKTSKFDYFYHSVATVQGMSWAFLIAAVVIVPRTWQDRAESPWRVGFRQTWQRWAHGSAATRQALRRRLLGLNAVYWLTGRDRMKVVLVWMLLGAGALLWAWGLWRYPTSWKDSVAYLWTGLLAHTILKIWIATEACRRFGADRKSGALELLLATPLRVHEILRGQLLALSKQFAAPAAAVLLVDFIFMISDRNEADLAWVWGGLMTMFVADLITLSWVGMWMGLTSRHTNRAAGGAILRVLVLPWILFFVFLTFIVLAPGSSRVNTGMSEGRLVVVCAITIGLINNLFFTLYSRQRLLHEFRLIATQRVESRGWLRKRKTVR